MAGERASTTRQRERGQRCCICTAWIGGPNGVYMGPRHCPKCAPTRRIYMSFSRHQRGDWACSFFEENLFTTVGRTRHFGSDQKIRDLVARTPTHLNLEDQQAFDYGLSVGRGAVWLSLTLEQYGSLREAAPEASSSRKEPV